MSSSVARRENANALLQTLPDAELVEAVIGRDAIAAKAIQISSGTHLTPTYPFALGPGEVGCFLSHRKCWQQIVDQGLDWALIAEDDLQVNPDIWADVLTLIESHASPDMYIRLPAKARETPVQLVAKSGSARLFLPRVIGLQTVFQVVGRVAAQRLLDASTVLDRPVDSFVQMHWATGQPVHTILPNGVSELTDQLGGSTIQKKTRTSGKLAREIKRFAYRTQVALRPQKG
jgi:GR25 family glycosyltransferase involved in LPS biosynthesis